MNAARPERPLPPRPGSGKRSEALPPRPFAPGSQPTERLPRPTHAAHAPMPQPTAKRLPTHPVQHPSAPLGQPSERPAPPSPTPPQARHSEPRREHLSQLPYDPHNLVQQPTYDQPYRYSPPAQQPQGYPQQAYPSEPYNPPRQRRAAAPHPAPAPSYPGYHAVPQQGYPQQYMPPGYPMPAYQTKKKTSKGAWALIWGGAVASVIISVGASVIMLQPGKDITADGPPDFSTSVTDSDSESDTPEQPMPPAPPVDEVNYVSVYTRDDETVRVHRFAASNWREYGDGIYATQEDGAHIVFDVSAPQNPTSLTDQTAFVNEITDRANQIAQLEGLAGVASVSGVETNGEGKFRAVVTYSPGGTVGAVRAATVFNVSGDQIISSTAVLINDYYIDDYDQMLISGLEVRV